jgi:ribosomal protein L33
MPHPSVNHRFQDQNLLTFSFAHRVLVKCPKWQQRAEVTTDFHTHQSILHCVNCHYYRTSLNRQLRLSLNVYCNHCSNRISIPNRVVTARKHAIRIRCQECGHFQSHQPTYSETIGYGGKNLGSDPFFGLDLWLQVHFRNHLFWAYNHEHLGYIEAYIGAKLRERHDRRYSTLVERLPDWVKSRKNREDLLRLISRMKER